MRRYLRERQPAALIVAIVALVVAAGGSAVAAGPLGLTAKKRKRANNPGLSSKQRNQVTGIANTQDARNAATLSVRHATTADTANSATSANTANTANSAITAGSATTAGSAGNANTLGGLPPSTFATRYFARVSGAVATPTLVAGSPGVTVNPSRPFSPGAVEVDFPVDMTNCAIVATGVTGGPDVGVRQSSISSTNKVDLVTYVNGGAESNQDFNVIAMC